MTKFLTLLVCAAVVSPIVLGIWWLIWKLWLFVVPAMWPTGPANFIHPGYWLFVGGWVLLGLAVGRRATKAD